MPTQPYARAGVRSLIHKGRGDVRYGIILFRMAACADETPAETVLRIPELLTHILRQMNSIPDLGRCRRVSKLWNAVAGYPRLWEEALTSEFDADNGKRLYYKRIDAEDYNEVEEAVAVWDPDYECDPAFAEEHALEERPNVFRAARVWYEYYCEASTSSEETYDVTSEGTNEYFARDLPPLPPLSDADDDDDDDDDDESYEDA
jgi:hypothetical protein